MVSFHGNIHLLQEEVPKSESKLEGDQDRVYLDLTPVKSFLHCAGKKPCQPSSLSSPALERAGNKAAADSPAETAPADKDAEPCKKEETSEQVFQCGLGPGFSRDLVPHHIIPPPFPYPLPQKHSEKPEPEEPPPQVPTVKIQTQQQNITFPQTAPEPPAGSVPVGSPQLMPAHRPKMPLPGEWEALPCSIQAAC